MKKGFTLIEILVVISIATLLLALSGPAIQSLSGAGSINKAVDDLEGTVDLARTFATAHSAYVRIAFSQLPAGTAGRPTPVTLALILYPGAGDTTIPMGTPGAWLPISHLLILNNIVMNDDLNASSPETNLDAYPSQSDMVNSGSSFTYKIAGISPDPVFTSCIQLTPLGEAQVLEGTPARYIKMAFDRPAPLNGKNPFILRVSGINGSIDILRKENGIQ